MIREVVSFLLQRAHGTKGGQFKPFCLQMPPSHHIHSCPGIYSLVMSCLADADVRVSDNGGLQEVHAPAAPACTVMGSSRVPLLQGHTSKTKRAHTRPHTHARV